MAVDLIEKLKILGLLGDRLLHTTNGKEYITPERLLDEVYKCLEDNGGRVAIVDLPGILGVDFSHCDCQARVLLRVRRCLLSLIVGSTLVQQLTCAISVSWWWGVAQYVL